MSKLTEFATPYAQALAPYQTDSMDPDSKVILLNANESAEGLDYEIDLKCLNRYPEPQPKALRKAYSDYCGAPENQIVITRGGDEAIDLLIRTYCVAGQDAILVNTPTFSMYKIYAQCSGVATIEVPLCADMQPNLNVIQEAIETQHVKLIYLCTPNNPTGTLTTKENIKRVLEMAQGKALVIVDEAYVEFSKEPSVISWLKDYDNLVVTRTLSKAFALAGIRCGFTIAHPDVIASLLKVLAPYPVPTPVFRIALCALSEKNIKRMRNRVTEILERRDRYAKEIRALRSVESIYPSDANFLCVKFKNTDGLDAMLRSKGILLRNFSAKPGLENCFRISIGSEEEMSALICALLDF